MRERLGRFGEAWIIDKTDGFRLGFVEKMDRRFRSTTPDMRAALQGRTNLGLVYS